MSYPDTWQIPTTPLTLGQQMLKLQGKLEGLELALAEANKAIARWMEDSSLDKAPASFHITCALQHAYEKLIYEMSKSGITQVDTIPSSSPNQQGT